MNHIQKETYFEKGYLVVENLFTEEEIVKFKEEINNFENQKDLPNVICEDTKIRSVFAPHLHSEIYSDLYKDRRLLDISKNLIEDDFYLYQYKLNLKEPFMGKMWEWHQDFPYWKIDDGVHDPERMVSAMIYLDDTKSFQGPLMVIPRSHKDGIVKFKEKEIQDRNNLFNSLSSNLKFSVDNDIVQEYADKYGIEVLEYSAGSVIFFHPNLFHASVGNLSPYKRDTVIITYNNIQNLPKSENPRPEYICSQDYRILGS